MTLCDLGFTECQERLYRALVADEHLGIGALAKLTGTDDESARAELAGLVRLGALETDQGAAAGVRVVHPLSALRKHVEEAEDELLRRRRAVSDVRAELEVLSGVYALRNGSGEGCELVESADGVRNRLRDLSVLAVRSLYAVRPCGPRNPASIAAARRLDLQTLGRGVDLRVIHQAGVLEDETNRDCLAELAAAGAKIRLVDAELDRLVIMDGRVAMVPIDPADSRGGVLVVRHAGVIAALDRLFARMWIDAELLHRQLTPPLVAPEISDADRRLLEMLASGHTDEAAARALDVSVRHLRRKIAALMRRLDAGSRFEAGVLAARRGWL